MQCIEPYAIASPRLNDHSCQKSTSDGNPSMPDDNIKSSMRRLSILQSSETNSKETKSLLVFKGRILEVLGDWPERNIQIIVVIDGERILGFEDLVCQGMGIPMGKLALYSVLGGVRSFVPMSMVLSGVVGEGMGELSLADRATITNMSPEFGATMGFFPMDHVTLQYLKLTGRSDETMSILIQQACNLSGFAVPKKSQEKVVKFDFHGQSVELKHDSVVLGVGLVAKKSCELGL
ncbi:hypothetical protein ZIOFF_018579 [Zingiber officinale]|uniref:Malic enzyme N-terminal domain-containing protein n=1 Tax=Zingiber officinale TaxID=94328 RepID=A0A8J5LRJ0_ZINOF|nr:hypothetical protein ZIOFF_018579 [Zingiber officinale]